MTGQERRARRRGADHDIEREPQVQRSVARDGALDDGRHPRVKEVKARGERLTAVERPLSAAGVLATELEVIEGVVGDVRELLAVRQRDEPSHEPGERNEEGREDGVVEAGARHWIS